MKKITLNHETHVYSRDDGAVIPGVTSILGLLGGYDNVPTDTMERKASIGKAAHKAFELLYFDSLDWESVHPAVLPYVLQANEFLKNEGSAIYKFMEFEHVVYHSKYIYAGSFDLIATTKSNVKHIIEIKCTCNLEPQAAIQIEAYFQAYNYGRKEKAEGKKILWLKPEGYCVIDKDGPGDFGIFLSALNIYNWRKKYGR